MPFYFTLYDGIYELKTTRKKFWMLVIPKNYENLNELQGAVSL